MVIKSKSSEPRSTAGYSKHSPLRETFPINLDQAVGQALTTV